mgnify:FL=1
MATRVPSNGCEGGTMRYLCWLVEFGHGANGPSLWSCAGACCCHAHMGRAHTFAGRAHAAAGGEKRDESTAGTPLSCVAAWAVHALCARRPCESRTMSENVSTADLSQRYGSPYAERGHVCVRCVVLCVAARVRGGRGVRPHARGGRRVLEGPPKGDSLHTHFSFAFWTICRQNASLAVGDDISNWPRPSQNPSRSR